jgi:hypothetical protein
MVPNSKHTEAVNKNKRTHNGITHRKFNVNGVLQKKTIAASSIADIMKSVINTEILEKIISSRGK